MFRFHVLVLSWDVFFSLLWVVWECTKGYPGSLHVTKCQSSCRLLSQVALDAGRTIPLNHKSPNYSHWTCNPQPAVYSQHEPIVAGVSFNRFKRDGTFSTLRQVTQGWVLVFEAEELHPAMHIRHYFEGSNSHCPSPTMDKGRLNSIPLNTPRSGMKIPAVTWIQEWWVPFDASSKGYL